MGILPGHTGLISLLEAGILKYLPTDSNEWQSVAVGWGYLEVCGGEVRVLAETVQTKEALERADNGDKTKGSERFFKKG